MRKKYKVYSIILLISLVFTACNDSSNTTTVQQPVTKPSVNTESLSNNHVQREEEQLPEGKVQKEEILSYEEYVQLTLDMEQQLKIKGFHFKSGSSKMASVTLLEDKLTFGTRNALIYSGKYNPDETTQPTNRLLIFEDNKDKNKAAKQLAIRIAYTKSYIGNDMVDWIGSEGFPDTNQELANKTDLAILSYKNLIVSVHLTSKTKADKFMLKESLDPLVEMLEKY